MGELKSVALFSKAEPCHSQNAVKSCPFHSSSDEDQLEKKGCCDDKSELVKLDEEVDLPQIDLQLAECQQLFAILPANEGLIPIETDRKTVHYLNYKPPLIVRNLFLSLQTFLI